jgi:uncharacterized repeat protein (TIGR03837 family)
VVSLAVALIVLHFAAFDNRAVTRRWDLFCRVIDNFGDIGVSWRLAADLAARGEAVRLWVDDATALAWMAPAGARGVAVVHWSDPAPDLEPADVVIETFGCDPPAAFVRRMAERQPRAPVWINLEYLSAQAYAERSHALPSPQLAGPGMGLHKWFFYPGFTEATGGLLREPGLAAQQATFDRDAWLGTYGLQRRAGERVVSLFCYPDAARPELLRTLAASPTLLLCTPGALDGLELRHGGLLRSHPMPWLTQLEYDRLLWSCDLNFVRGEDSVVRASWAGVPFVWQPYRQAQGLHAQKLDAFLDRFLAAQPARLGSDVRALWRGWNRLAPWPAMWPESAHWHRATAQWRSALCSQSDLTTRLLGLVNLRR